VRVDLDAPAGGPRLASVFARLALGLAEELERRLAAIRSLADQDEAH
jgi:hypothetical protein